MDYKFFWRSQSKPPTELPIVRAVESSWKLIEVALTLHFVYH